MAHDDALQLLLGYGITQFRRALKLRYLALLRWVVGRYSFIKPWANFNATILAYLYSVYHNTRP